MIAPSDPSYRFTFATFPASGTPADCLALLSSAQDMPNEVITRAIAIEILQSPSSTTVLISAADSLESPAALHCVFGISDDPEAFDRLAPFGVPLVEGEIKHDQTTLMVTTVAYDARGGGAAASPRSQRLLTVTNLPQPSAYGAEAKGFAPVHRQMVTSPDVARPGSQVVGRSVESVFNRQNVMRVAPSDITVTFDTVLYPDLFKLVTESTARAGAAWVGDGGVWEKAPARGKDYTTASQSPVVRLDRAGVFGRPAFVFDDVEIVGFRTELTDKNLLQDLVKPLNFHREQPGGPVDFVYRPATATLIVELLRYGKMRALNPAPPLTADDFTSQHELLVRILVGRVDDDTAQARDPAMFVPAIFVDNPWSKALGRQLQGFPKRLAEFYAGDVALDMTGCARTGSQRTVPLHEVTAVRLATGAAAAANPPLLTLNCPDSDGSADDFIIAPLPSILMGTFFRRARFEQFDFDEVEFRRSFARQVVADQFQAFSSVQVSPVIKDVDLPRAWITGRCTLKDVEAAFPTGLATLEFGEVEGAPEWNEVRRILPEAGAVVAFPTGDWYRLRCSMDLIVDDGLNW